MTVELSLVDVHAGYGPVEVLHGVTIDVPRGAVTALLGPNGAGKTTAISVVAGLVPLRAGRLEWAGADIAHVTTYQRAHAGMLVVPERRGVFGDLSVRDNLAVFAGGRADFDVPLETFPMLRQRLDQRAGSLSGGEQQMLAMSRALLQKPRLLLLDEISLGLAPRVARALLDVVAELTRAGTTVVVVEQHLAEALRLADVVYVLSRGEVVFAGEPGELAGRRLPGYVATG